MDEEQALQQAIALSLGTPVAGDEADANGKVSKSSRRKVEPHEKKDRRKRKKGSQEQFTMDEIASIFAVIDERGNGKFSKIELEGIVRSFDFSWSKQEIADMIDIFDDNKDGQLDICEFQNMFGRLNMLQMHEM
ncbi:hypothetical protein KP509_19G002400 [Ceratopteris richardii]|nr:hypothetical protein KP509_19G002400 [Ceratopteris richardii]